MWYLEEETDSDIDLEFTDKDVGHYSLQRELLASPTSSSSTPAPTPLASLIGSSREPLGLYGTVPPPKRLAIEKAVNYAKRVAADMANLKPTAVVVYDIQDEPSRNDKERPYPFSETYEPREFARMLRGFNSNIQPIVYRAMRSGETERDFVEWVKQTVEEYDVHNFVLVGARPDKGQTILTVPEAASLVKSHTRGICIGGITIAERHRNLQDEHKRIDSKTALGLDFFTSQVVYNADNVIWLLQDYAALCESKGTRPAHIFFTFAPFGSQNTANFMEWLGIEIPLGTQKRVLSRADTKARVAESMAISLANFERILAACRRLQLDLPIGFSVEAVSKSKLEAAGATKMYSALQSLLSRHQLRQGDGRGELVERLLTSSGSNTFIIQKTDKEIIASVLTGKGPQQFGKVQLT